MRNVYLYGDLAKQFGPVFRIRANTVGAVIRLLEANFRGKFMARVLHGEYRVVAGKGFEDENATHFDDELVRSDLNLGSKDLHIMPTPQGSGGVFRVVLGVVLIGAALVLSGGTLAAPLAGMGGTAFSLGGMAVSYGSIALFGASMVLGGLSQMLTPVPKIGADSYAGRETADERPSFIFNGAVNTTEQGGPVPVIYGRMRVGSTVISGGITTENI
jgi:predicted phage tail protein